MPDEFLKDSLNKSHGIRSGEPKRPESLIEIPNMVPEVPEVSLCITQEKTQPHQQYRGSYNGFSEGIVDHHQKPHQNETLHRNRNESYNTWKAKNAQTLHSIAGSQERSQPSSKPNATKYGGLVRKPDSSNRNYSPPMIAAKYYTNEKIQLYNPSNFPNEHRPQVNGHLQVPSKQLDNTHSVQYNPGEYMSATPPPQYHQSPRTKEDSKNQLSTSTFPNQYTCQDRIGRMVSPRESVEGKTNGGSKFSVPNQHFEVHCPCVKCREPHVSSVNGNQCIKENPSLMDGARTNVQYVDPTKLYPPLDAGLINNHLSSLFHIINIQNEQISMLCHETSSQKMIITALHEEVKKIYAAVCSNRQVNSEITPAKGSSCNCYGCEYKNDEAIKKTTEDITNGQKKCNIQCNNKKTMISGEVAKRSVGVMTSSLDNSDHPEVSNESKKPQVTKEKVPKTSDIPKSRKQHKPKVFNSSPNVQINKRESQKIEKKKSQDSAIKRKNKKDESDGSSQSGDSFSLDEAAVVIRTEPEPCNSPEVSIHVSMPDYSASSAESDSSDSSQSEDEGQASGSGGESSDPQIGWTFYDRVVGQVNHMLKKTSSDPRHEYTHNQRKNAGNVLYQCNGDYETENNWSKRVTFDGPPLEDSDNNGMHMPRYHHFRTNQDYRMPVQGGQERVQDFMVCDYANGGNNSLVNGSTNMSFATYRYYQRHQLLPPPPAADQVFLDQTRMKKKSKSKKSEKTPPTPHKTHKKRNAGPPSKILDVSALKHQPKLF